MLMISVRHSSNVKIMGFGSFLCSLFQLNQFQGTKDFEIRVGYINELKIFLSLSLSSLFHLSPSIFPFLSPPSPSKKILDLSWKKKTISSWLFFSAQNWDFFDSLVFIFRVEIFLLCILNWNFPVLRILLSSWTSDSK